MASDESELERHVTAWTPLTPEYDELRKQFLDSVRGNVEAMDRQLILLGARRLTRRATKRASKVPGAGNFAAETLGPQKSESSKEETGNPKENTDDDPPASSAMV